MKADRDDMPEYLKTRKQEGPWRMVAIMGIGTAIVVGGISLFGKGFIDSANTIKDGKPLEDIAILRQQRLQQQSQQPQKAAVRRESYGSPQPFHDDDTLIIDRGAIHEEAPAQQGKQTVFNDQNYRPQGAVNVVSLNTPRIESRPAQTTKQQEVVVVGQEEKPGDWVCSYFGGEGSIDRRNCKSRMQLHKRNQSYTGNRNP